jgi:rubrerythrin
MREEEEFEYLSWKNAFDGQGTISVSEYARLNVSMDMGWQKRGSGRHYDSLSGHACLVGLTQRKVLCLTVKIKVCTICKKIEDDPSKSADDIPEHECLRNHIGLLGSMESDALVEMIHDLFDRWRCTVDRIVTDDDSTMKAHAKWNDSDYIAYYNKPVPRLPVGNSGRTKKRPNYGQLRGDVPEPGFLADPAHRKKTLRNRLYALLKRKKANQHGWCEMDILRLTTNFIYMIHQLPGLAPSEWPDAARAVLEHHFDNHSFCGDFCKRLHELCGRTPRTNKVYRCKQKDKELYTMLLEVLSDFTSMKCLSEVAHPYDTNVNEALNNIISWLAPKNKNYCLSHSLINRISVAICIYNMGFDKFYEQLFRELGIDIDESTRYYLQAKEKQRTMKSRLSKTLERKKKRNQRMYAKLREHTDKIRKDKKKNAVYASGIGFDNAPKDKTNEDMTTPTCKDRQEKKPSTDSPYADTDIPELFCCRSCGRTDHRRSDSKLCPNNNGSADGERLEEDANMQSQLDEMDIGDKQLQQIAREFMEEEDLEEDSEQE